ncbi:MAG: hypothetical protein ACYCV4_09390 [Dermatophilaceae bacterium]
MTAGPPAGAIITGQRVCQSALGLLAVVVGGFQIVDGIHVLRVGTYLGSATPGPWATLVAAVGLNPLTLGPLFILLVAASRELPQKSSSPVVSVGRLGRLSEEHAAPRRFWIL